MRYLLLLLLTSPLFGLSQNLEDFKYFQQNANNKVFFGASLSHSNLSNNAAPFPENHIIKGLSAKIDMRKLNFNKAGKKFTYQHKLLADVFLIVRNQVIGDGSKYHRQLGSSITNGLIGWYSQYWNIVSKDKFAAAIGFNLNDYFLSSTYNIDSTGGITFKTYEPQGYWFAAGPSVSFDFAVTEYLNVNVSSSYSMGYWRAVGLSWGDAEEDDDYPNPHFYHFNLEILSKFGAFVGVDYQMLVNRGHRPNNSKRLDFLFGMRLPISKSETKW